MAHAGAKPDCSRVSTASELEHKTVGPSSRVRAGASRVCAGSAEPCAGRTAQLAAHGFFLGHDELNALLDQRVVMLLPGQRRCFGQTLSGLEWSMTIIPPH